MADTNQKKQEEPETNTVPKEQEEPETFASIYTRSGSMYELHGLGPVDATNGTINHSDAITHNDETVVTFLQGDDMKPSAITIAGTFTLEAANYNDIFRFNRYAEFLKEESKLKSNVENNLSTISAVKTIVDGCHKRILNIAGKHATENWAMAADLLLAECVFSLNEHVTGDACQVGLNPDQLALIEPMNTGLESF